jgi:long-chain acyl-CoA synthetase
MWNITETYRQHAVHYTDKTAIQTLDKKMTYKEWYEAVAKIANWLKSFTLSNQTVAILLPNGIPFLQVFMGAAKAGWLAVPMDVKWKRPELQKRLELSNPSILITTKEFYERAADFHSEVIVWEKCDVLNRRIDIKDVEPEGNQPFYMGFTSGTSGEPKAFIRAHQSWVASFDCSKYDFNLSEEDFVLIPGTLIHSHFLYGAASTLYLGGTLYIMEKFSPTRTIACLEALPITTVYAVPTMTEALLQKEHFIDKEFKIISSGSKWFEKSKAKVMELFPRLQRFEFYGASELSFVTVLSDQNNEQKPGSVGKPCYGVELEIRRPDQSKAAVFETGKIYVRSNLMFTGYKKERDGEIQQMADKDGWTTVDDMGYLDEDGFLYIAGREKNIILYGAINIYPEEIERIITLHPQVEEAVVIGISNPYWGEIVSAVIKGKAEAASIKKWCKKHLASYKIPRKYFFRDEMPYTMSGKIARAELKSTLERQQVHTDE